MKDLSISVLLFSLLAAPNLFGAEKIRVAIGTQDTTINCAAGGPIVTVNLPRPRAPNVLATPTFTTLKRRCLELLRNEMPRSLKTRGDHAPEIPEIVTESFTHEASV